MPVRKRKKKKEKKGGGWGGGGGLKGCKFRALILALLHKSEGQHYKINVRCVGRSPSVTVADV